MASFSSASAYLIFVLSSLTTVTLSVFFTLSSDVPCVSEACVEGKQCLRLVRSLACVGMKGKRLEDLGFLKRSKIPPRKDASGPLCLSPSSVIQGTDGPPS